MKELDRLAESLTNLFTLENPDRQEFDRAVEALAVRFAQEGKTRAAEFLQWLKGQLAEKAEEKPVRTWDQILKEIRQRLESDAQQMNGQASVVELARELAALSLQYGKRGQLWIAQELQAAAACIAKLAAGSSNVLQPILDEAKDVVVSGWAKLRETIFPASQPPAAPDESGKPSEPHTTSEPPDA